jgi:hypothetical protein
VVIRSEEYEKLLDDLEELRAIREYDEAKAAGETPIPFGLKKPLQESSRDKIGLESSRSHCPARGKTA